MLIGKYSKTFKDATHALPEGMHMNADYPFMLPEIINRTEKEITILGKNKEIATAKIIKRNNQEYIYIYQSSSFEKIFRKSPHKFKCFPFISETSTS